MGELLDHAEAVVRGTPIQAESFWSSDRSMIYTTYRVRVDGVILGDATSVLEVTTQGGRVGETTLVVSNFPALVMGLEYLLLLSEAPGYRCVIGGARGAILLPPGRTGDGMTDSQIAAMIGTIRDGGAR